MMRKRGALVVGLAAILALAIAGVSGCSANTGDATVTLNPSLSSPTIIEDGYLTVGIDTNNSPYSGLSGDELVGIDIDVAAALAEDLGLELKLVDLTGVDADSALKNKNVDIVMNLEKTAGVKSKAAKSQGYLYDAPALFAVTDDPDKTVDVNSLNAAPTSAQSGSVSAWTAESAYASNLKITLATSFSAVFDALSSGDSTYAAADLVCGAYISKSYDSVYPVALLSTPEPLYIGALEGNSAMVKAINSSLDNLENSGVLKIIYTKWLGSAAAELVMPSYASKISIEVNATTAADGEDGTLEVEVEVEE